MNQHFNNPKNNRKISTLNIGNGDGAVVLLLVIGLFLLLIGKKNLDTFNNFKENALMIEAIIRTEQIPGRDINNRLSYNLYAEYEINNQKYREYLGRSSTKTATIDNVSISHTNINEKEMIYVNKKDYHDIKRTTDDLFGIIFMCMGALFLILFIISFFISFLHK